MRYDAQLIEQTISLSNSEKINPDVVAVSNKYNHAIVSDCKSGNNIQRDQDLRYSNLSSDDLKYFVTIHDSKQLTHTMIYVDNETNHPHLEHHTSHPFITFGKDRIYSSGRLIPKELADKFITSISLLGSQEPTSFYPFSPIDDDHIIAPHVMRGLVSFLLSKGHKIKPRVNDPSMPEKILKLIHPYDLVSSHHKTELCKKIKYIITIFLQSNSKFREQIKKIEMGEYTTATLQSTKKICETLLDDYEAQKKITDDF